MDDASGSKSTVDFNRVTKTKLGRQLLEIYSDVVNQGVPDGLTEIVRSLEWSEGRGENRGKTRTKALTPPARKAARDSMLAAVPSLRAFAISLSDNADRANDLVRETLLWAGANLGSFKLGNNMSKWLFTILRDLVRSEYRKSRREGENINGFYAEDFRRALKQLPADQREALILVGASGFSYEEAAQICGCAVGTIKSRVNRARIRLAAILSIESAEEQLRGRAGTAADSSRRW
jgi:RNA polymerase sigma-70 factor, ECF subfamily